ncbi:MAG: methyltransferase type 11, partial [Actinobacteria bacterium]|nr:methyltransferase type 11 [Actinomycetota bacterium]
MSRPETVLERLLPAGDTKACCGALYESEAVQWLLDGQLHPGGDTLTLHLAQLAGIRGGHRVLDVAS